jgi:hypothetical protein
MKIKIERQKPARKYPYIGIHGSDLNRLDPLIVYFIADSVGIALCVNEGCSTSTEVRTNWCEEIFERYDGTITLQND